MRSVGVDMDWSKGPFHLIDAAPPPIEVISKNSPRQDKEDQSADT